MSDRKAAKRAASSLSRRRFLSLSAAGSAGLALGLPRLARGVETTLAVEEPWAGFATLGEGIWAVASTPVESGDWRTGCNGGLVAGSERVLAIESFASTEGAAWVASQAAELTGHRPTDLLVTHFHGDHTSGLAGFAAMGEAPRLWLTEKTRALIRESDAQRDAPDDPARVLMLEEAILLAEDGPTELELGGRAVRFVPRRGHTPSDVTVELDEPSLVFFGDLLWNGIFPNYRDTIPTPFAASVRSTRRERQTTYVPGHGVLADDRAVGLLLVLIDSVEAAARAAFEKGIPAAEAAAGYALPAEVSDWILFNPRYPEVAIGAWLEELGGSG
jgi:glyoxylase-like metal-dependent hydrolase (beta-lactamase superfamily II)